MTEPMDIKTRSSVMFHHSPTPRGIASITVQTCDGSNTLTEECDGHVDRLVEIFGRTLLALGFHSESIKRAFAEMSEDP